MENLFCSVSPSTTIEISSTMVNFLIFSIGIVLFSFALDILYDLYKKIKKV